MTKKLLYLAVIVASAFSGLRAGRLAGSLHRDVYDARVTFIAGFPESYRSRLQQETGESHADVESVLTSPALIRKAAEVHKLKSMPPFVEDLDLVGTIRAGLKVTKLDEASSFYEVRYRSTEPMTARAVVRALIIQYSNAFHEPQHHPAVLQPIVVARSAVEQADQEVIWAMNSNSRPDWDAEDTEREIERCERVLAEKERELPVVIAKSSTVIRELIAREPTFLLAGNRDVSRVESPHSKNRLIIAGGIFGAVLGMLVVSAHIYFGRRSESPSDVDLSEATDRSRAQVMPNET